MFADHHCWEIEIYALYEIYDPPDCRVQFLFRLCRHHITTILTKIPMIHHPISKMGKNKTLYPYKQTRKYINIKIKQILQNRQKI